jgi:hypothetical protein
VEQLSPHASSCKDIYVTTSSYTATPVTASYYNACQIILPSCIFRLNYLFIDTILILKRQVLKGIPLPPDDILQPPGPGLHQVLPVNLNEVSISLGRTVYVIASFREVAVPCDFFCVYKPALVLMIFCRSM